MSDAMRTLAVDVGGTGIKGSVLDAKGTEQAERVRVATTYPMTPEHLVEVIGDLAGRLPEYDRVSVGFPGVVREGAVRTAPHFVTKRGPGTPISSDLTRKWDRFDLAGALLKKLGKPTRVANDADLQGAAVIAGKGLEMVVTLGTGVGTALFWHGRLAPHLELAHHPFRRDETYNEQIGDAARKRLGKRRWNRRVREALRTLDALVLYDHLYVGGGNATRINFDPGPDVSVISNEAGILGGIKLWEGLISEGSDL